MFAGSKKFKVEMELKKECITVILMLMVSLSSFAQSEVATEVEKDLTNGTIEEQLDYVERKSNNYQEFKVIKKTWYTTLKQNVNDSIELLETEQANLRSKLKAEESTTQENLAKLMATQDSLTETRGAQNNMKWIGISMEKPIYRIIMWGIILVLGLILLVTLIRFKVNNSKTKLAKADLEQLQTEFEEHRKGALLREQKLRRELQDEVNARRKREGGNSPKV